MSSHGQQHHHGIRKNIVEGIGGVIIGAAAVLLLTQFIKGRKTAGAALPAPEKAAEKPAEAKTVVTGKTAKPAAKAAPRPTAKPAAKRATRKPASKPEPTAT